MALTKIEYGSLASSETMNNNFEYLDNRISTVVENVTTDNASIYSNIASINSLITQTADILRPIGQPLFRLDNTLLEDEIRLEGAEVSRTTYSRLFTMYGVTYGAGDGVSTFKLPDFRNRVLWGSDTFGYLEEELPNIKGSFAITKLEGCNTVYNPSGAFCNVEAAAGGQGQMGLAGGDWIVNVGFDASHSSTVYKDSGIVRPKAISVRVVTRYK